MQLKYNLTLPPPNHLVKIGTITPIAVPLLVAEVYVFFFNLSLPIDATIFKVAERAIAKCSDVTYSTSQRAKYWSDCAKDG
jgi:hypothetical protein